LPTEQVVGDTAYDPDHFRQDIAAIGAAAVIPCLPLCASKFPIDKAKPHMTQPEDEAEVKPRRVRISAGA
jgi:hypothetical protein